MSVLTIDLGTFCDNTLMLNAIEKLHPTYKIVYVTDEGNSAPSHIVKVPYKTPDYFLNDADLKMADPQASVLAWSLQNPVATFETVKWMRTLKRMLRELVKIPDLKAIVLLYPALMLLWQLPREAIEKIPVFILYYAPGFPNLDIPWIFDSVLKDEGYPLYIKDAANMESTLSYFKRATLFSGMCFENAMARYKKATHVVAWDPNVMPTLTSKMGLSFATIGALLPKMRAIGAKLPKHIQAHLRSKIVFITFGSYASTFSAFTSALVPVVLRAFPKCHVVIHNGPAYHHPRVANTHGFLPYEKIVPHARLVVFTGSVCLQNICLYHRTPMLFVPLLTEQFFWAKNYQYQTHIPFVTLPEVPGVEHLVSAGKSERVRGYLAKVSHSMRSLDAAENLLRAINHAALD